MQKNIFIFCKKLFLIAVIFLTTCCQKDPYKFLYGKWKFYKCSSLYGKIGKLTQEQADALVDDVLEKEIIIAKTYIIINGQKYDKPIYELREVNAQEYLIWDWRISPKNIGMDENVKTLKVLNIYIYKNQEREILYIKDNNAGYIESFDEIVFHEGELGICYDTKFFHLKKVK